MGLLDGKVAIVTGAGAGLGREHALLLAEEGAQVVVNDVGGAVDGSGTSAGPAQQVVDEISSRGAAATANTDDVAEWEGAQRLVQQAVDEFGRLDVLVNNAGILRDSMSFNMDEPAWDAVIRVHLKGHFAPSHHAARHWRERAKAGEPVAGRIINTTSESGLFGNPGQANYAAAKAGIAMLTVVLARELERYGVTANAVAPRARTRMTEDLMGEAEADEAEWDPLDPANVSPLVAWLASDDAADVSGQVFVAFGDTVQVTSDREVVGEVSAGGRPWRPEELVETKKELFARRDAGVPPFGLQVRE